MKQWILYFAVMSCMVSLVSCTADGTGISTAPAQGVIERFVGRMPDNIVLTIVPEMEKDGCDAYSYRVRDGKLIVKGSSQVALCKGFYDFVVKQGYGIMTWSGSRCDWPDRLPRGRSGKVVSPFENHLFYNVCTFGYSMAYWTWTEWSKEIDWLALHGFDMPLAPIAGEAVFARVWKDMGLSDEEINAYFTGPGHFPWMRMGNMTGLDGAPSQEWHDSQIELQHKIVDRMRSLDMEPVFQGFAGFVPKAMKKYYPGIDLVTTKWSGFENYMLSPIDSLFYEIQKRYIREWESEFGKGKYYLIDSFNELDIPFGEQGSPERAELLEKYSSTIYGSLTAANPDAVWVMQGWMFGYQRDIWDPQSIEALLGGVPDDKLMIIDLAVDFNRFIWQNRKSWEYIPGMYGKDWIYSTTPNFGGRTAMIGNIESYLNGHLEALNCSGKGNLTGFGVSPEGTEQNEVLYEALSDAGWRDTHADLMAFLERYSTARYGACPEEISTFWREIVQGPYGECTNNARYRWQLRPVDSRVPTMGINSHYFKAIESFLSCADEFSGSSLYRDDAIAFAAMYLAAKADAVLEQINWGYVYGVWKESEKELEALESRFEVLLTECDRLLESHPVFRLERWMGMADRAAADQADRDAFHEELRRLVTVWGGPNLSDYSARLWSGLVRDYYLPRWKHYFSTMAALDDGAGSWYDYRTQEEKFHASRSLTEIHPYENPLEAAVRAVENASDIEVENNLRPSDAFGYVSRYDFSKPVIWKTISVYNDDFRAAKAVTVSHVYGNDTLFLKQIAFSSHNDRLGTLDVNRHVVPGETLRVPLDNIKKLPELAKEVNIQIAVKGRTASDASLIFEFTE